MESRWEGILASICHGFRWILEAKLAPSWGRISNKIDLIRHWKTDAKKKTIGRRLEGVLWRLKSVLRPVHLPKSHSWSQVRSCAAPPVQHSTGLYWKNTNGLYRTLTTLWHAAWAPSGPVRIYPPRSRAANPPPRLLVAWRLEQWERVLEPGDLEGLCWSLQTKFRWSEDFGGNGRRIRWNLFKKIMKTI